MYIYGNKLTVAKAKHFHYANKWISNDQINHKSFNSFWKAQQTTNAQITQILKFKSTHYMGDHMKNLFWPRKFLNPKCTLCHSIDKDTWPYLLQVAMLPQLPQRPSNSMTQYRHPTIDQPTQIMYTHKTLHLRMHATMSRGFLGITSQNPIVSKSNLLQHGIFQIFFINLRYIA